MRNLLIACSFLVALSLPINEELKTPMRALADEPPIVENATPEDSTGETFIERVLTFEKGDKLDPVFVIEVRLLSPTNCAVAVKELNEDLTYKTDSYDATYKIKDSVLGVYLTNKAGYKLRLSFDILDNNVLSNYERNVIADPQPETTEPGTTEESGATEQTETAPQEGETSTSEETVDPNIPVAPDVPETPEPPNQTFGDKLNYLLQQAYFYLPLFISFMFSFGIPSLVKIAKILSSSKLKERQNKKIVKRYNESVISNNRLVDQIKDNRANEIAYLEELRSVTFNKKQIEIIDKRLAYLRAQSEPSNECKLVEITDAEMSKETIKAEAKAEKAEKKVKVKVKVKE